MAQCPVHGRTRKTGSYYAQAQPETRQAPEGMAQRTTFEPFVMRHACGGYLVLGLPHGSSWVHAEDWPHGLPTFTRCQSAHALMPAEACEVCGYVGPADTPPRTTWEQFQAKPHYHPDQEPEPEDDIAGYECVGDFELEQKPANPTRPGATARCAICSQIAENQRTKGWVIIGMGDEYTGEDSA